jgi:hypothetical protein
VTPGGKIKDWVILPNGPWIKSCSTLYTLRHFPRGPACYSNMRIWAGNGQLYIGVSGDPIDTSVEGVYRLDARKEGGRRNDFLGNFWVNERGGTEPPLPTARIVWLRPPAHGKPHARTATIRRHAGIGIGVGRVGERLVPAIGEARQTDAARLGALRWDPVELHPSSSPPRRWNE